MPSHTAASGLIKLYSLDGAPWNWPAWQERTGIYHGLFPPDDKHLPRGWSRQDSMDVFAYFTGFNNLQTEDQKIQFSKPKGAGSNYPGRTIWNSFVSRHWNKWGIHNAVIEELRDWDIHPVSILLRENGLDGEWPAADTFSTLIYDTLAMKLFGEEAFPPNCEILGTPLRKALQPFVQRSWNTIRAQVHAQRSRKNEIEAVAHAACQGKYNACSHTFRLYSFS